jgi:hypothetical protein
MLQIISTLNNQPEKFPYSGLQSFLPGQIVKYNGGEHIAKNISTNATNQMLGVVDDIYSHEVRTNICKRIYLPKARNSELDHSLQLLSELELTIEDAYNIKSRLFWSSVPVFLNSGTSKITIPPGSSKLLFKFDKEKDLYYFDVRYTKCVSTNNKQDSSQLSKFTVYTKPIIMKTDLFDVSQNYPKGANLYFNDAISILTTARPHHSSPVIGIVAGCNIDGGELLSCAIDINNELTNEQREIILNTENELDLKQKLEKQEDKQINIKENQVLTWNDSEEKWVSTLMINDEIINNMQIKTEQKVLDNFAKTGSAMVRESIAQNENTSVETLTYLSKDNDKWVRLLVAQNKNTPDAVLKELENDLNADISLAAKNNYASTFFPGGRNYRSCQPIEKDKKELSMGCMVSENVCKECDESPEKQKLSTSSSTSPFALTAALGLGIACLIGAQQGKSAAKIMKK